MIGPLCDALVDCPHESCREIDDAMTAVNYERVRGHDLPLPQRAALLRSYTWNGTVREEMTLQRFIALQRQAEAIYDAPPMLPPTHPSRPLRFLDFLRRKPTRCAPR